MSPLLQLSVLVAGCGLLVGLAAWSARRHLPPSLDETLVRGLVASAAPGEPIETIWIPIARDCAFCRTSHQRFIVGRVGQGFLTRSYRSVSLRRKLGEGRLMVVLGLDAWNVEKMTVYIDLDEATSAGFGLEGPR